MSKAFDKYYSEVFGPRWPRLCDAMATPVRHIARINAFAFPDSFYSPSPLPLRIQRLGDAAVESLQLGTSKVSFYVVPEDSQFPAEKEDQTQLLDVYFMDQASVYPPLALDAAPGMKVLDMCAAPGGKSLILCELMQGRGNLFVNDPSDLRRKRLKGVFDSYIPRPVIPNITITGTDGARWTQKDYGTFDRVLVDAPCSTERHVISNAEELRRWKKDMTKRLSTTQADLLLAASKLVKPGGRIVYSTCSISPLENDAVVRSVLTKRRGDVRVLDAVLDEILALGAAAERTELGLFFLPDVSSMGPIYMCVLERAEAAQVVEEPAGDESSDSSGFDDSSEDEEEEKE